MSAEYSQSKGVSEKVMFSLLWDIEELKRLNNESRKLRIEISSALDVLSLPETAVQPSPKVNYCAQQLD